MYGAVSHCKQCSPSKEYKLLLKSVLGLMKDIVGWMGTKLIRNSYPQVSGLTMKYICESSVVQDINIFRSSLQITSIMLGKIFPTGFDCIRGQFEYLEHAFSSE